MEMMTGRHAATSIVAERLVREAEVFGEFDTGGDEPPIRLESVHHLEKSVNGAPLRRPPWYFDVRIQGDGLADIPTHLVDQAQRFVAAHGAATDREAELLAARRWSTPVPRALFARVTGLADFPPELRADVEGDVLAYAGNAELSFRLRGVDVHLTTRWDLTEPAGGGDAHSATVTGTDARLRVEQGPHTGFRRRLVVEPRGNRSRLGAALQGAMTAWQPEHPGLAAVGTPEGFEIAIPAGPGTGHEGQFPLVLDEFLRTIDRGGWPDERAADTLAKYELLARALASGG
jgi:predicted dehydrogenase